jgi:hypothetical protein
MSVTKETIHPIVIIGLVLVSVACSPTLTPTPALAPTSAPTVAPTQTSTNSVPLTRTLIPASTLTETPCPPDSSKYGFESADVLWVPQVYTDSQAVTTVTQSERNMAKFGCYSLKLSVDLVGGHANKSKGETYVDMRFFGPTGTKAPTNLEGMQITAWVRVPGVAGGDPSKPNGLQVFVKDERFRSEYGTWFNLTDNADGWMPISLTPGKMPPPGGFMDPGFDPTKIIMIGIKIGVGAGSAATYKGPVYVDGVNW